jgi:pimeloyl-ACP methyl ester carboxylesterase
MRIVLESGRRVAVHRTARRTAWLAAEGLDPGAEERVVVFCHCAPGAGMFDPDPVQTQSRGVTLLSVDRPGYGGSEPVTAGEWPTVGSAAGELAAVLDALGGERVGVVGWSAGGRVALALAALRPDLVDRIVVVATPAPDDEIPWVAPEQRTQLERLRELAPAEALAELGERLRSLVPSDPFSAEALWLLAAVTSDEPALRGAGVRNRLGEMLRTAFAQGPGGLAADIAGYCLQPWGFEPEEVHAKTLLLYGSHDPIAGPAHGRWWEARLPDASLEVVPEAGHLLVIPMWSRILCHVAPGRRHLRTLAAADRFDPHLDVEEISAA